MKSVSIDGIVRQRHIQTIPCDPVTKSEAVAGIAVGNYLQYLGLVRIVGINGENIQIISLGRECVAAGHTGTTGVNLQGSKGVSARIGACGKDLAHGSPAVPLVVIIVI